MEYEKMTIAELTKENQLLMNEKIKIKAEQRKLNIVLEEKISEDEAKKKVESMSDPDKKAMTQVLSNVGGIKSEEKVGKPGT